MSISPKLDARALYAAITAVWDKEFDYTPEQARKYARDNHESDGWVEDFLESIEDTLTVGIKAYLSILHNDDLDEPVKPDETEVLFPNA